MKPAPFSYHAPESISEAIAVLEAHGDEAKVLAGGQSLVPILALRLSRFEHLVDLRRIEELRSIEHGNGSLRVGAMVTQAVAGRDPQIAEAAPLLARATPFVGHFQIRNRGTVGGSIAHADPAAEYPAVAQALEAEIELAGPAGTRRVPASEFFFSTWMTVAEPEEVVVAVHLPVWEGRTGYAVHEVARRHGDFALAGVVCGVELDGDRVGRAAIGLLGMGTTPVRATAADKALAGAGVDGLDLTEVGRAAVDDLDPPSDLHLSGEQRKRMAASLVTRALDEALQEARNG